ncbi:ectonucleotide pyrophosphatase/phosphodiesterase family member 7 [Calypte anna]|uniref:ectonucleotide pyrophosphatase/phosphodiesterase family member 7 n=1 Tax=Calypte anna TaxID=9244 RepID=UPI0011C3B17D|nr:ectonucleotide pyrophosphatase/phosphodiesterase family member 7 [Calypte anna]
MVLCKRGHCGEQAGSAAVASTMVSMMEAVFKGNHLNFYRSLVELYSCLRAGSRPHASHSEHPTAGAALLGVLRPTGERDSRPRGQWSKGGSSYRDSVAEWFLVTGWVPPGRTEDAKLVRAGSASRTEGPLPPPRGHGQGPLHPPPAAPIPLPAAGSRCHLPVARPRRSEQPQPPASLPRLLRSPPARGIPLQQVSTRSKLLLVSFDGFRWNYDQDVDTPNLDTMAVEGVKAQYMTPTFITITSPCHFTLLTGRYLENHGVIHNMWFDTKTGVKLPYYSTQGVDSWWDNGSLPIWITAQRQGLKTGSIHFPGGRAKYQGEEVNMKLVEPPLFYYSNETNWRESIDTVMKWFTVNNLDFIALYFGEPDSAGHKFGPESKQRKNMIKQVDRTVGYLRQQIRESGLQSNLNLIITSDHGMETVIKTNEIHIKEVENFTFKDIAFELLDYGPNGLLVPKEGKLEHVYSVLKNAHPNLHVYKKEEFPKRFHYANHSRITPLILYSDPGYVIHGRYKVQLNKGEHGFDNENMNMKTIFRAVGPAFKQGLVVEPFESINVYALLCELLGIIPEPHDGSLEVMKPMLRESAGTGRGHRERAPPGLLEIPAGTATSGGIGGSRHLPGAPCHRPRPCLHPGPIAARCRLLCPPPRPRFKRSSPRCQEAGGGAGNCSGSELLGRNPLTPPPRQDSSTVLVLQPEAPGLAGGWSVRAPVVTLSSQPITGCPLWPVQSRMLVELDPAWFPDYVEFLVSNVRL